MLATLTKGRRHERRAARMLRRHGLKILARNVRAGRDEIDLVARDADVVVVVEVRHRKRDRLAADLSVDRAKAARLRRAWGRLARDLGIPLATRVRFDLVLSADDWSMSWHRGVL